MAQSSSAQRDPSMEEILASIRKIIEEGEEPAAREQRDDYEPAAIGPAANDTTRPAVVTALQQRGGEAVDLDDTSVAAAADVTDFSPAADAVAAEDDLMLDEFELQMNDSETGSELALTQGSQTTLMSEEPVRQVKASFSELTEALAASRRRSLDDIAEDVLRPMLQEWLDNNLPTLVERLVREEIERVARGG